MRTLACIILAAFVAGCSPQAPDASLVLWEQPAPEIAARAHAREKDMLAYRITGRSMEPLLVEGDFVVIDIRVPYAELSEGDVVAYQPDWLPNLVLHRLAAKSGDSWKLDGINNGVYDPSYMSRKHYWGRMVQGYTRRARN
jgi:signal peptidase I